MALATGSMASVMASVMASPAGSMASMASTLMAPAPMAGLFPPSAATSPDRNMPPALGNNPTINRCPAPPLLCILPTWNGIAGNAAAPI